MVARYVELQVRCIRPTEPGAVGPKPNKGLELTASSVRFAPTSGSSSGLALDINPHKREKILYPFKTASLQEQWAEV